jgi:predicted Zn-ribbon and HTH transcriptional regulator
MKKMIVICKQCGYEKMDKIYEPEEAAEKEIRLVPPRCEKCGSTDVELRD